MVNGALARMDDGSYGPMPLLWPGDLTKATERCSLDSLLHRLPAESGRERWGIEERLKVTRRFAQWREKLELRGSDGGGAGFGCNEVVMPGHY